MAFRKSILTTIQKKVLDEISRNNYITSTFYLTGGTALTEFYLHHRLSEDIDLFSEKEFAIEQVRAFLRICQIKLGIIKIDHQQVYGLQTFFLYFPRNEKLKVDFNYYPFPRIEKGIKYVKLTVDSMMDIAVNKIHTISMNPRARDFVDIFFIVKETGYDIKKLLLLAKAKFDWHIDPLHLGSRFYSVTDVHDYPRMLKKIDDTTWKEFFINEAKALKPGIFE